MGFVILAVSPFKIEQGFGPIRPTLLIIITAFHFIVYLSDLM